VKEWITRPECKEVFHFVLDFLNEMCDQWYEAICSMEVLPRQECQSYDILRSLASVVSERLTQYQKIKESDDHLIFAKLARLFYFILLSLDTFHFTGESFAFLDNTMVIQLSRLRVIDKSVNWQY
jgi:hypothetical protein